MEHEELTNKTEQLEDSITNLSCNVDELEVNLDFLDKKLSKLDDACYDIETLVLSNKRVTQLWLLCLTVYVVYKFW